MRATQLVLLALILFLLAPAGVAAQEPAAEPAPSAAAAPDHEAAPAEDPAIGGCTAAPLDGLLLPDPLPVAKYPRCEDVPFSTPCAECPEACTSGGNVYECACEDWGYFGERCMCPA